MPKDTHWTMENVRRQRNHAQTSPATKAPVIWLMETQHVFVILTTVVLSALTMSAPTIVFMVCVKLWVASQCAHALVASQVTDAK